MTIDFEQWAKALFNVWRTDQTGDTWQQLSDSERAAWVRVAVQASMLCPAC